MYKQFSFGLHFFLSVSQLPSIECYLMHYEYNLAFVVLTQLSLHSAAARANILHSAMSTAVFPL
jgi:hypothetical protein